MSILLSVSPCMRLAIDLAAWKLPQGSASKQFQFCVSLLSPSESEAVLRFVRDEDRTRALVSRLLQRHCVAEVLGVPWTDVAVRRTKGGKPFVEHDGKFPNFNYNVSHEGNFVAIASEPECIVGLDISAPTQLRRAQSRDYGELHRIFQKQFTSAEWAHIRAAGAGAEGLFRLHWSLKEAFVKARGDGIVFDLQRIDFEFPNGVGPDTAEARARVDGVVAPQWRLWSARIQDHWFSVARCRPTDIIDGNGQFTTTFRHLTFTPEEWATVVDAPFPPFVFVSVRDLLPAASHEAFDSCADVT